MGVCAQGTRQCQAGGNLACVPNTGSSTEICDGLDNDCDGQVDEGFNIGTACTNGSVQGVCQAGTLRCMGTTATQCVSTVMPGTRTETCNNQDDDCDGQTDEGLTGNACSTGQQGVCSAGTSQCMNGTQTCVRNVNPSAEICDGLDNNCMGGVDEGNPGGGASCTTGQNGVCSAGTQRCQSGALACVRNVNPSAEICDGLDNDCDNQTDEGVTRICYAGPAGTSTGTCPGTNCNPTGACEGVTQACSGGAFPACTMSTPGQTFPGTETCNNVDDDCDGTTDENLAGGACTTGQQGVCNPGTERCMGGSLSCVRNVNPSTEQCNNLDDDCDGVIDDNVTPQRCFTGPAGTFTGTCPGADCTPRGQCRVGSAACSAGMFGMCMGQTLPTAEICDGLDNDCNGSPDNGLITDADGDGSRACNTCGAVMSPQCDCNDNEPAIRPNAAEVCDGRDNNCNGQTDEGSGPNGKVAQNCYSGPTGTQGVGVCTQGTRECNSTMPGMTSFGACTSEVVPSMELCNSRDDDCDGTVDDGFDVDGDGFVSCAACNNAANCDCNDNDANIKPGAVETCDTVDQNCNGQLDDVPARRCFAGPNVTPDTYTGTCPGPMCNPKGVCVAGMQMCSAAGAWGMCNGATLPANAPADAEMTCNNADDDCDGTIDDGNFDKDMDGVRECDGDCDDNDATIKPGAPEICDGKDNNCDMTTDGVATACYSGPMSTAGKGICRNGTQQCQMGMGQGACAGEVLPVLLADGGVPQFNPDAGINDPEALCNNLDDDCDGIVDDGFDLDGDGVTTCENDCDDADRFNFPGNPEFCDCKDNNCNTQVDEGDACRGAPCHDFDGDGFTNCAGDCNDTNAAVGPQISERPGNNVDDDCDGATDEDTDEDGDGFSITQGDCNDRVAAINPGAVEVCDGFDNDCDNQTDEGFDQDNDFATTCAGDCDDTNAARSPFRREVCGNGVDENCDGRVDEDTDADGDGVTTCQNDCNDFNASVHPAGGNVSVAMEICDGQDNDCDGLTDEGFDVDGDFVATCFGDCDDTDDEVNPNIIEVPANSKDDDCDGLVDEGAEDRDNDGFSAFCGDCNDSNSAVNPHANELCDRIDNNCDSFVDSAPGQPNLCAVCFDADMDGQTNCDGDCNDADPTIFRGAPEICDVKDNDCDGDTDLDPATGLRVCTEPDGGTELDAGTGGGTGSDGGMLVDGGSMGGDEDGGMTGKPSVFTTGCGCTGGGDFAPFVLFGLVALLRRRRSQPRGRAVAVSVAVLSMTLLSCTSALETPELPDGGGEALDGGGLPDGGRADAGFDAGMRAPACPDLDAILQVPTQVPGSRAIYAHPSQYTVTENAAAELMVLDDGASNIAGFVLRRPLPADIDPTRSDSLDTLASRELQALANLAGTPLVRDRVDRFNRLYVDNPNAADGGVADGGLENFKADFAHGETMTFATATNPFSVRNRLVLALSGRSATEVGTLPVAAGSTAEEQLIVYLGFRVTASDVFVSGAVTTAAQFRVNQTALNDLTNGTHLSKNGGLISYECETVQSPPLKTDFIFVVDNSASMLEEQAALANSADALFAAFNSSGLDFRIGVITTDSDVLRGTGFTSDLAQFKSDVRVGINGNGFEMGIEYALRAVRLGKMLMDPSRRIREDAGLVVVFVTDEENAGLRPVASYASDFVAERAVAFGIVGPRPFGCTRVGLGAAVAGTQYIDLAAATGGSTGSICNPNLTEVVEEILFGAIGASSRARLRNRPISGSLAVKTDVVVPRARENGFDYDPANNTVLFFGATPPAGVDVTTAYGTFVYLD
ncbi:MAG: MopE-related protein [Archangium sp.]